MADILINDEAMPPGICDFLAAVWTDNAHHREGGHEEYWAHRIMGLQTVQGIDPGAALAMRAASEWAICEVEAFFGLTAPLYVCAAHLVGWPPGFELHPHVDDAEPHVRHHHFSAIFYLTSDHEGGELYFPGHGVEIEAKRGRFVSAPCGPSHEHGVKPVTRGTRITLAFFLTHDPAHAFRQTHPELG